MAGQSVSLTERDKLIFEHANKNHTHQDTLRWFLAAGFGAFFYGGITLTSNPNIAADTALSRYLELALIGMGTCYFFILLIEGWYYNLYLAYLIDCEDKISKQQPLNILCNFDRSSVAAFHPSWIFVLSLVIFANDYHICRYVLPHVPLELGIGIAIAYFIIFFLAAVLGQVPRRIDATLTSLGKRSSQGSQ